MLNPFYWYSIIWTIILFLYSFGYSAINAPLSINLKFFFGISIILSGLIGFVFKDIFKYHSINKEVAIKNWPTFLIIMITIIEFIYTKQIPLLSIARGQSQYGDFAGIPIVHTLLINFIIFYSSYLFYIFIESKDKNVLYKILIQLSAFLLMFQKGVIILSIFIFLNLLIAKLRLKRRFFSIKNLILFLLFLYLILYLNGVLANIRSGFKWYDNSYIYQVTQITTWPKFIPQQLIWAYTYVTTPLGNLNQLVNSFSGMIRWDQVVGSLFSVNFVKQLFPDAVITTYMNNLTVKAMNASTGFLSVAIAGGIVGVVFFWISTTLIITLLSFWVCVKRNFQPLMYDIFCTMIVFCFFYDTFATAQTSLLPLYIWLFYVWKKLKS